MTEPTPKELPPVDTSNLKCSSCNESGCIRPDPKHPSYACVVCGQRVIIYNTFDDPEWC